MTLLTSFNERHVVDIVWTSSGTRRHFWISQLLNHCNCGAKAFFSREWYPTTSPVQQHVSPGHNRANSLQDESFQHLIENHERQNQAIQQLIQQQQQGVLALTLQQPSLKVFSGDPINYCDFTRAFEHIVERKTLSSSARLYYLVQYTSGAVEELMKSCLSMREEEGYTEARRLLQERYGQNYKIAAAHIKRLVHGPTIRIDDGPALQQFSIQLLAALIRWRKSAA